MIYGAFMSTFAYRLKELRAGRNSKEFAAMIGIGAGTLSQYERGLSLPTPRIVALISERLGITVEWLLHGIGSEQKTSDVAFEPAAANLTRAGLSMVPLVEAVLSAGGGSFETEGNVLDHFAFHTRWLQRKGRGKTDGMVLMRVAGDSMEPAIYNNDLALIDQRQTDMRPGRVYAVTIEDMIYLKLVNAEPGKLILSSFNKNYKPVEIPTGDMQDAIRIIGRAIWWCHDA